MEPVRAEEFTQILETGQVFFDYGPVSMVVNAVRDGRTDTELIQRAFPVIDDCLKTLSPCLPVLRRFPATVDETVLSGTARVMADAVKATGDPLLTPMAAVAGSVADQVADFLSGEGAEKVSANNGGDIAVRLRKDMSLSIGVVDDLSIGKIGRKVLLTPDMEIGGVATSGLGGRSLTMGIASAVTVFSARCAQADALATLLANRSYLASEAVHTVRAGEIDPDSDIAALRVVTRVDTLSEAEKEKALSQILAEADKQYRNGLMRACIATVQQKTVVFDPEGLFRASEKTKSVM